MMEPLAHIAAIARLDLDMANDLSDWRAHPDFAPIRAAIRAARELVPGFASRSPSLSEEPGSAQSAFAALRLVKHWISTKPSADDDSGHMGPANTARELAFRAVNAALTGHEPQAPDESPALRALVKLFDWARENTGPRDPNSPHDILCEIAGELTALGWQMQPNGNWARG